MSRFIFYRDKADEYRWRFVANNGEIVAVSEGYTTKADCLNGIDVLQREAQTARVEKDTAAAVSKFSRGY